MASPRGACLSTRAATCLGFANPDGFILPPGLWPNSVLAGNSWPDVETALALARPTLNLSETPGPRKSLIALGFQGDAGTRAPVNSPSILLLCSSLFMGLPQHLSGGSQPGRRAESCSQALDCCVPAGSHCISRLLWVRVTSVYHPPSQHLHPHLAAVRPPSLIVFSRNSASGSASQVLCFQNVLGSHHYQQRQDLVSRRLD